MSSQDDRRREAFDFGEGRRPVPGFAHHTIRLQNGAGGTTELNVVVDDDDGAVHRSDDAANETPGNCGWLGRRASRHSYVVSARRGRLKVPGLGIVSIIDAMAPSILLITPPYIRLFSLVT